MNCGRTQERLDQLLKECTSTDTFLYNQHFYEGLLLVTISHFLSGQSYLSLKLLISHISQLSVGSKVC